MDDLDSLPPDDDLPLRGLLEQGQTAAPRADALRQVLARQERWRVRTLAGVLAAVLLGGPVAGYALAQVGSSSGTPVAAQSANTPTASNTAANTAGASNGAALVAPGAAGGGGVVSGYSTGAPGSSTPAQQLFLRTTADGVRIRGYLEQFPAVINFICTGSGRVGPPEPATAQVVSPPAASPGSSTKPAIAPAPAPCPEPAKVPSTCPPNHVLQAQVSNDQVAGAVGGVPFGSATSTDTLSVLQAQVVGADDPTPIGTVLVHTSAGVASVRLTITGGASDAMAPVNGYAIVAATLTALAPNTSTVSPPTKAPGPNGTGEITYPVGVGFPKATVQALDSSGKVLASVDLPGSATATIPTEPPCASGPMTVPAGAPGQTGSAGSGASSGTVSSSGASASSGSATVAPATPANQG